MMAVEEQDWVMKNMDRSATPHRKGAMWSILSFLEEVKRSYIASLAIGFIDQGLFKIGT
jgi:hypothetical protein